jgi:RND superfamily putative drug exporter
VKHALARFPARRSSWIVVAAWLCLVVVFAPLGSKVPSVTTDEYGLPGGSQTTQLNHYVRDHFPGGDQRPVLIVYRREGGLTQADRGRIMIDAREIVGLDHVAEPVPAFVFGRPPNPGLVSRDGEVAITIVPLRAGGKVFRVTPTIEELRDHVLREGPLETHVTGNPALISDYNTAIKEADAKLLLATVALVLVLLIAVYRSPILALIPLLVVGLAYAVVIGIVYVLNRAAGLAVDSASSSLLLVLMFGAGTDYCLLFVSRYRSALRRHSDPVEALRATIPEAAAPMVASALTVIAAMLVMLAGIFGVNRTIGPVNAIGIAVVLLAGLTVLPALLALLGRRAFWPYGSSVAAGGETEPEVSRGRWRALGLRVQRRPALWLLAVVPFVIAGTAGFFVWQTQVNPIEQFRGMTDGTRGYHVLSSAFPPGAVNPTSILVERKDGPVRSTDLAEVRERATVPGVEQIRDTGRRSEDGRAALLDLVYADNPFGSPALDRTQEIRDRMRGVDSGLRVLVGAGSGERLDIRSSSLRDTKVIIPLVLVVVLLTLIALLRALVAPLYLLATVIVSFAATLGTALLAFKYVFGQDSFSPGIPLIIFILLVALGSDYNMFLMSRIREEAQRYGTREGTLRALSATGPVITSAGLILAGTFGVLTIIPNWDLDLIGFSVALGVLFDTFVVRSICVPAITWLVGERSWWPSSAEEGRKATVVTGVYTTQELLGVKKSS